MAKRKKAKQPKLQITPRNPFATDPLMKKGGVHQKTFKSQRKNSKNALRKQIAEHSILRFFGF